MNEATSKLDAAIGRVLLFRPGATLSQIRNLVPSASRLPERDLTSRVERLRSRLVRQALTRSRVLSSDD
ncbi:hypothetical protein [Falsiroseomonas sp. E2-1-a20]|uniref:hypothetical protein n=1 Tax=Falsiroseomonas sp. E2-1-a20 TaxID=3239300 RepID=UPI003F302884